MESLNMGDARNRGARQIFSWVDYLVFSIMLLVSWVTGVYYYIKYRYFKTEREPGDLGEYLTANKGLSPIPVGLSLVASYISAITMLGTPAEIYVYGTQYWVIILGVTLSGIIIELIFLPVYSVLDVKSSYEYLEMRFGRHVRTFAAVLFIVDQVMFLPLAIAIPSLAFAQVSDINPRVIGLIVTIICVFYTAAGGLKAVVWTDTFQLIAMFLAALVVIIYGSVVSGGISNIWDINKKGGRIIFFNMSFSLEHKHTFPSVLIGQTSYWTSYNAVNQTMVQKYLSMKNLNTSKKAVRIFTFGVVVFISICCYAGLLIYAHYHNCDPLQSKRVGKNDQIFPLYTLEIAGKLKGIPGLFIAGVFGAALSTLSVIMNATSLVVLEDIVRGCMKRNPSEAQASLLVIGVVVALGATSLILLLFVEKIDGILIAAGSLTAIGAGTSFGIFLLGLLLPWTNHIGALTGGICGFVTSFILALGNMFVTATQRLVYPKLNVSVESCQRYYGKNVSYIEPVYPDATQVFLPFRISFHWVAFVANVIVITVGLAVSFATGKTNPSTLDPQLVAPVVQRCLPAESNRYRGLTRRSFKILPSQADIELLEMIDRAH